MRTLVVYNPKGGVGKSAIAVNLAATLAADRQRTLLIDLDPQATSSRALAVRDDGRALTDALTALDSLPVRPTLVPGLDLVPSGPRVVEAERILAAEPGAEWVLRDKLGRAAGYDMVLLDPPPGVGSLARAALVAAEVALVPVVPTPTALEGLAEAVAALQSRRVSLAGIVATMERRRTPRLDEVRDALRRRFGEWLLEAKVRFCERVEEAAARGRPVVLEAPASAVVADFRELACELWSRLLRADAIARTA